MTGVSVCVSVRCLSAVEAELDKQREEHSHAQLLKQEVVRDTAATQEQLNGVTSSHTDYINCETQSVTTDVC